MNSDVTRFRIRLVVSCVIAVACVFIVRLYLVQIVHGDLYSERADRQYVRPQSTLFDRGSIFFTTKTGEHVAGATTRQGYIVAVEPRKLTDIDTIFSNLEKIIPDLDKETFYRRAQKKDDPYEVIASRLSKEQADAIKALDTEGVSIYKDAWRVYPGENLASHVLGFISFKDNVLSGQYGLERFYETILRRDADKAFVNFFAEIFSNIKDTLGGDEPEGTITTSIEPSVQAYVEETLESVREKWTPEVAGAIIMNPHTGEIYSMAVSPSFNPNSFSGEDDYGVFVNPLVENVYELGSIVKPLTIAAGIDTGAISPTTTYEDKGSITLDGATIYNHDRKAHGVIDMQEVLGQSLNTGVSFVVSKMGNAAFAEYFKTLLQDETGIDLPNEGMSQISNLESPRNVEYATASFGQGIAVTPISMVRALSTLANGGVLVEPHLMTSIDYKLGVTKNFEPVTDPTRVFDQKTTEEVSRMLVHVVDNSLVGGAYKLDHYAVAAKTGTAQIAKANGKGYYDDRFLHSFFGYFPAYNPKFIVFLYMVNPRGADFASQTLSSPFSDITKFLINYYDVPPDR